SPCDALGYTSPASRSPARLQLSCSRTTQHDKKPFENVSWCDRCPGGDRLEVLLQWHLEPEHRRRGRYPSTKCAACQGFHSPRRTFHNRPPDRFQASRLRAAQSWFSPKWWEA